MKNYRAVVIAFICGAIFSALLTGSFLPASLAQENPQQTPGQFNVFTYPGSQTGFFDRNTGMIYLYDPNLEKCTCIRQVVKFGQPMKKIMN